MKNIRIGFVPAHREPFDETWAEQMRKRCLDVGSKIRVWKSWCRMPK